MMKRILNIFFALVATVGIASAQSLSVQSVEVQTSQQTELAVTLTGGAATTALQFNLQLPAGVTANTSNATLSTAADGHTLTIETLDSGDLLFVVYSMDLKTFKDGELLRIPVTAGNTEVSSQGKLYTVRTSTTEAVSHDCADVSFAVKVKAPEQPVTITADNLTMTYGNDVPTLTYKSEGGELKGTPKLSTTATKTSPVGTYPITVKQGTVTNTQVTYVAGTLTITKAPLTVTANSYTIKQGEALPAFAASYSGFKNNETEAVLTKKPTLKTTATSDSAPGTYDITASGAEASNYDIKYVAGKLTIAEADPITVTVKSVSREYGEVNPAFDYTVEGGTLDGKPAISCTATAKSDVGTYDITIAKGTVKNHNVTFVAGKLTITKAPLTVSVESVTREQYKDNPEFVLTYYGWKNNDDENSLDVKPVVTTTATKESPVGSYPITISGGRDSNYSFVYQYGTLTVTEPTGVRNVNVNANTREDDAYYTLDGKKLDAAPKKGGVYIKKGRLTIDH